MSKPTSQTSQTSTASPGNSPRHGLNAELCTPPGKLPYLHVSNPQASALTERVYAQADSFWFSWADRIAGCDELPTAG